MNKVFSNQQIKRKRLVGSCEVETIHKSDHKIKQLLMGEGWLVWFGNYSLERAKMDGKYRTNLFTLDTKLQEDKKKVKESVSEGIDERLKERVVGVVCVSEVCYCFSWKNRMTCAWKKNLNGAFKASKIFCWNDDSKVFV